MNTHLHEHTLYWHSHRSNKGTCKYIYNAVCGKRTISSSFNTSMNPVSESVLIVFHRMYFTYCTTFHCPQSNTNIKPHLKSSFRILNFASNLLCLFISPHRSSPRLHFASLSLPLLFSASWHPCLWGHHLYLYKKYTSGSAIRPLKGSYFAKRFTACLTLREKDGGITPSAGVWMISQAHPPLYRALNKRLAGFTSSSDEDFNIGG